MVTKAAERRKFPTKVLRKKLSEKKTEETRWQATKRTEHPEQKRRGEAGCVCGVT
jgi:hypothetical protein